ncbi:10 kDa chaperonin 1, chloroplastic isoform X3 [Hevea brasiliensis]|uniref:10 kDa chaperonin 1, chloroplastic isoform X3 n=1 Tax=Hevea brasiliensis TaxID=3981 RepID=UPI0025D669F3|nr:10 kDa chaperonin 1, chloroplastic isoform X3 [Hevea brasiliensis]
MASSFVAVSKPFFFSKTTSPSLSHQRLVGLRKNSLRINAIAKKWEPTKKSTGGVLLPKSAVKFERYLMGEVLSVGNEVGEVEAGKKVLFSDINAYEVDLGTDASHCFCKAGDLLAVVE